MIYKLENAINLALSQKPLNSKGETIACIKISQSAISYFTDLDYKVVKDNGTVDIIPEIKNEYLIYEDQFNVPLDEIDTYLRSRPRLVPIKSKTVDENGKPLYNIRILYKKTQTSPFSPDFEKENFDATYTYLVVRDLYFRNTAEGQEVIRAMGEFEDVERIDAKVFLCDYQVAELEDLLLSKAIQYGYTDLKFDTVFKILYGYRDGEPVKLFPPFGKLHERGSKELKLNELAFFYKSSIPMQLNYIDKSDNYCDKLKTYKLPNFNKPPVKLDLMKKVISSKGITLVNNLISDEVVDYLFPKRNKYFEPKSIMCMQLEEISNQNPQYPVETFDEYNVMDTANDNINGHIALQKSVACIKDYDVYIVPDISIIDADIVKKSIDKHIIVLVKSKSYLELCDELSTIRNVDVREQFIHNLNAFIDVGTTLTSCTSFNVVHSTIKNLLQKSSPLLSLFRLNDYLYPANVSYSAKILHNFLNHEQVSTLMLSKDTVPKYMKKVDGISTQEKLQPELPVDYTTILNTIMTLSSNDLLPDILEKRISFTKSFTLADGSKQAVKITAYSSSDNGDDINLTIKKYRSYSEENLFKYSPNLSKDELSKKISSIDNNEVNNLLLAIKNKYNMTITVNYFIDKAITAGKTVLLVDPLYSIHEDVFNKDKIGTLRILRTQNKEMIKHVSADLSPDIVIYHKCTLQLLIETLDTSDEGMFNVFSINISSEDNLINKLTEIQKVKYKNSNKLFMPI